MTIRVGVNGFGRIGRAVFRLMRGDKDLEVVAINDITEPAVLAHLLRYDSIYGRYAGTVEVKDGNLVVDGKTVRVLKSKDIPGLPWRDLGVVAVVESTGIYRERAQLEKHLAAGASKVLLTVPPKDAVDALVVMGVNDAAIKKEHTIISNASCTTNCLAPLAKVVHEAFGIAQGWMTTVHAYTNDQRVMDLPHKDLRRARAAALNIIPTTTGAARAVGKVLPALAGRLDGMALRVPTPVGSVVDLAARLEKKTDRDGLNAAVRAAAEGPLKGILKYTEDPIVSSDVIGDDHSCVFDADSTQVMGGDFAKLIAWYDNEWAYSKRVVDLLKKWLL